MLCTSDRVLLSVKVCQPHVHSSGEAQTFPCRSSILSVSCYLRLSVHTLYRQRPSSLLLSDMPSSFMVVTGLLEACGLICSPLLLLPKAAKQCGSLQCQLLQMRTEQ